MEQKYNILWIQCDEMRKDSIGRYGGDNLTPNIDQIAREGGIFLNHFTTAPICVPARVSELTGCYPCKTGIFDNSAHYNWGYWPDGLAAFPECFTEQGYATANFGKYHTPCHGTWSENWHFEHFEEIGDFFGLKPPYDERENEILHRGHRGNDIVLAGRFPSGLSPTKNVTDHAIQWLKSYRHIRRPFFLRVSYLAPHTPVMPPEPFYSMYQNKIYEWDRPTFEMLEAMPEYEKEGTGDYAIHTEEDYQRMRRSYYGLVTHIDDEAGRLIRLLKDNSEYDKTIILITSDHGDLMGEYGQFQKGMFYDKVINVPCIIKAPPIKPGSKFENITECIDIGPTLMELCGIPPKRQFIGENMLYSNKKEAFSEIISENRRRSCIRTEKYCLDITVEKNDIPVKEKDYDGKLIDLDKDPLFHYNLYEKEEYNQVRSRLTRKLLEHIHHGGVPIQHGKFFTFCSNEETELKK